MPSNVKLLLTENVDSLGIVGDVVNVRLGYARNFLLPRNLATQPSEELIKSLAAKRAAAEKMLAEQRKAREELCAKLQGIEVHLTRSCNDQGILYGAITQQDVASELNKMGHAVKPRDIRLPQAIKRIDTYDVHVKLDSDLDSTIKLWVVADRPLDLKKDAPVEEPAAQSAVTLNNQSYDDSKDQVKGQFSSRKPAAEGKSSDKGSDKGGDKRADKSAEKSSEKAGDKDAEKAAKKSGAKAAKKDK